MDYRRTLRHYLLAGSALPLSADVEALNAAYL